MHMKIAPGVRFLSLPDARFKTAQITVALLLPLTEDTAAEQAIVPYLLRRGCAKFPDFSALYRRQNELYGARVSAAVTRVGEMQMLQLSATYLDDRYALEGEDIAAQCAELLQEMLFNPALEDGTFRAEDLEQERRCLIEAIEAEINEKRTFARRQCERLICAGEPYAVERLGTVEAVSALTREQVTEAWRRIVNSAQVQIIYQGSGDGADVAKAFGTAFGASERSALPIIPPIRKAARKKPLEQTEHMAVNQGKLVLGLRVGLQESHEQAPATRLMNAILGGTPHSLLFQNVREKLSLCYYCASGVDRHKGVMLIDSGVEADKVSQAREAILEQIITLQTNKFTDEAFASAKRSLCNQLMAVKDSQGYLAGWYLGQQGVAALASPEKVAALVSPEKAAALVEAVTREQVVAVAESIVLDGIYLLAPNGEAAEDE